MSSNGKTVASQATDVGSIPITRFYLFPRNQQGSLKTRNGFQAAFVLGSDVWHEITMRLKQRQPEKTKYLFQAAFGCLRQPEKVVELLHINNRQTMLLPFFYHRRQIYACGLVGLPYFVP